MATLGKILGLLCLVAAAADVALGVFVFFAASGQEDSTGIAAGVGIVYLAGSIGSAVLLATFGVTAWLVGGMASDAPVRGSRSRTSPYEVPYGASNRL